MESVEGSEGGTLACHWTWVHMVMNFGTVPGGLGVKLVIGSLEVRVKLLQNLIRYVMYHDTDTFE